MAMEAGVGSTGKQTLDLLMPTDRFLTLDGRGCVSGAQLLSMRELCEDGGDECDFDMIDGYDELK